MTSTTSVVATDPNWLSTHTGGILETAAVLGIVAFVAFAPWRRRRGNKPSRLKGKISSAWSSLLRFLIWDCLPALVITGIIYAHWSNKPAPFFVIVVFFVVLLIWSTVREWTMKLFGR